MGEKKGSNGMCVASLLMHYRFSSFYLNVHSCQCIILKYGRANYLPFSTLYNNRSISFSFNPN